MQSSYPSETPSEDHTLELKARISELEQEVKRLRGEIHHKNEMLHEKNTALDALHYVWCDGGCLSGVHRYTDETFTEEIVLQAEYQALRLRMKWNGMRWQIENWPSLPTTQTEWHRRHIEGLKQKIAYSGGRVKEIVGRSTPLEYKDHTHVWDNRGELWCYSEPGDVWKMREEPMPHALLAPWSARSYQRLMLEFGPLRRDDP